MGKHDISIALDKASPLSIADQLADFLLRQILAGALAPGEKLPAERVLAKELGISRGTVKRAYQTLAAAEAIAVSQGSGSYVLAGGKDVEQNRKKAAAELLAATLLRLESMGLSEKETLNLIGLHLLAHQSRRKITLMVVSITIRSSLNWKNSFISVRDTAFLFYDLILYAGLH